MPYGDSYEKRFWSRVKKCPNGCWEWQGKLERSGYARVRRQRERARVFVHRLSYEMKHGTVPAGLLVLHRCDNRKCVNPRHLYAGTHKDNAADMFKRGRANKAQGERHGNAKLTKEDVLRIHEEYASGSTQRQLALKYSVHPMHVHRILSGKKWAHVSR